MGTTVSLFPVRVADLVPTSADGYKNAACTITCAGFATRNETSVLKVNSSFMFAINI